MLWSQRIFRWWFSVDYCFVLYTSSSWFCHQQIFTKTIIASFEGEINLTSQELVFHHFRDFFFKFPKSLSTTWTRKVGGRFRGGRKNGIYFMYTRVILLYFFLNYMDVPDSSTIYRSGISSWILEWIELFLVAYWRVFLIVWCEWIWYDIDNSYA